MRERRDQRRPISTLYFRLRELFKKIEGRAPQKVQYFHQYSFTRGNLKKKYINILQFPLFVVNHVL